MCQKQKQLKMWTCNPDFATVRELIFHTEKDQTNKSHLKKKETHKNQFNQWNQIDMWWGWREPKHWDSRFRRGGFGWRRLCWGGVEKSAVRTELAVSCQEVSTWRLCWSTWNRGFALRLAGITLQWRNQYFMKKNTEYTFTIFWIHSSHKRHQYK